MIVEFKCGALGTLHALDPKTGILTVNTPPRMFEHTYIDQVQYRKGLDGKYIKVTTNILYDIPDVDMFVKRLQNLT